MLYLNIMPCCLKNYVCTRLGLSRFSSITLSHLPIPISQRWDYFWFLSQKRRFVSPGVVRSWNQYLHDYGTKICPISELSQFHSRVTDSRVVIVKESRWIWRLFAPTKRNKRWKVLAFTPSLHLENNQNGLVYFFLPLLPPWHPWNDQFFWWNRPKKKKLKWIEKLRLLVEGL